LPSGGNLAQSRAQEEEERLAKATYKRTHKKLPPKVAREIATLKSHALVKYHDEQGRRLHSDAIKAEMQRRVAEGITPGHPNENKLLKKHRLRRESRVLGAPISPRKAAAAAQPAPPKPPPAPRAPAAKRKTIPVRTHVRRAGKK
jgi:hypothetical protein